MLSQLFILIQWVSLIVTFMAPPSGEARVDHIGVDPHHERAPIGLDLFELIEVEESTETDAEEHTEEDHPRGHGEPPGARVGPDRTPRPEAVLHRDRAPRGPPILTSAHLARAYPARGPPTR